MQWVLGALRYGRLGGGNGAGAQWAAPEPPTTPILVAGGPTATG